MHFISVDLGIYNLTQKDLIKSAVYRLNGNVGIKTAKRNIVNLESFDYVKFSLRMYVWSVVKF